MLRVNEEFPDTAGAASGCDALRGWIAHWQRKRPTLSLRAIAARLGHASPAYLSAVLAGRKRVSRSLVQRLAEEIGLPDIHKRLALTLVDLESEEDSALHERLMRTLNELRFAAKPVIQEQPRARRSFLHFVIYEMMRCPGFIDDPGWIAETLRVTADPAVIARVLKDFPERPSSEPAHVVTSKDCRLEPDDPHWEAMRAWQELFPETERGEYVRFLATVPACEHTVAALREEFLTFARTAYARFELAPDRDRVVQFGLYLFPVTKRFGPQ